MVELLLEANADVNEHGGRPLRAASKDGRLEVLDLLLGAKADANAADARIQKTADGSTALMMAASKNHREVATRLLAAGANIKASDQKGAVALHYACHAGHPEMAAFLQKCEMAEGIKQMGNSCFKDKNYKDALVCWAEAREAWQEAGVGGHQLAVLFANEAQCRLNMSDAKGARRACEEGLKLGATEQIMHKLEERLAKSLLTG